MLRLFFLFLFSASIFWLLGYVFYQITLKKAFVPVVAGAVYVVGVILISAAFKLAHPIISMSFLLEVGLVNLTSTWATFFLMRNMHSAIDISAKAAFNWARVLFFISTYFILLIYFPR